MKSVLIYGACGRRSWSRWTKALYVVRALVLSASTQALAACLHEDVITLFCCHRYRYGNGGSTTMPVRSAVPQAQNSEVTLARKTNAYRMWLDRSEHLGPKGYCPQDRCALHRRGWGRGRVGRPWGPVGDVNKKYCNRCLRSCATKNEWWDKMTPNNGVECRRQL